MAPRKSPEQNNDIPYEFAGRLNTRTSSDKDIDLLKREVRDGGVALQAQKEEIQKILKAEIRSYTNTVAELKRELDRSIRRTDDISKKLRDVHNLEKQAKETLEKHENKIDRVDEQARNDKLQSIQILAIFVAFFTFVSVEFQLFAALKDPLGVITLTLVLLGALLLFVHLVVNRTSNPPSVKPTLKDPMIVLALILLIIGCLGFGWLKWGAQNEESQKSLACDQLVKDAFAGDKTPENNQSAITLFSEKCSERDK